MASGPSFQQREANKPTEVPGRGVEGGMLTIDVYSDVICPWCYIGKRRLEKGLALAGRPASVRWHPFELNPGMPREGVERRAYRVKKFGSWERSLELDAQVRRAGEGEGLAFNFDKMARTPNTFDSHLVVWLAGERGVQDGVAEAQFRGTSPTAATCPT